MQSYEKWYKTELQPALVEQYHVSCLPGILLSKRSQKEERGYVVCSCYSNAMKPHITDNLPLKCSFANDIFTGCFPEVITFKNREGKRKRMVI